MPATPPPDPEASTPPGVDELLELQHVARRTEPTASALRRILARLEDIPVPAGVNAPLPPSPGLEEGRLSPRVLVLLAKALSTRLCDLVLLEGRPLALLAALLQELPAGDRPRKTLLLTPTPRATRQTLHRVLDPEVTQRVQVRPLQVKDETPEDPPRGDFYPTRVLAWQEHAGPPRATVDDGLAITIQNHGALPSIHQLVRKGDVTVSMDLGKHVPHLEHGSDPGDRRVPMRRLLAAERHHWNTWHGRCDGRMERLVQRSVDGLFQDGPLDTDDTSCALARTLFHLGYLEQLTATRSGAQALYHASLRAHDSAESWTFIGWVHAQQGELEQAMDACRRAIRTDPSLGNPYNDIGAYLFALKRNPEAKTWFHRALNAPRYLAPHYPYTNLARIHLQEGDLPAARKAAATALESREDYAPARRLMAQIETQNDSLEP